MTYETQLWHVTLTVGGAPHDLSKTHEALLRLIQERPFIHSLRYGEESAEVRYWEESDTMVDAASLALRLWTEHRSSADLPDWQILGLEVVAKETYDQREAPVPHDAALVLPQRF